MFQVSLNKGRLSKFELIRVFLPSYELMRSPSGLLARTYQADTYTVCTYNYILLILPTRLTRSPVIFAMSENAQPFHEAGSSGTESKNQESYLTVGWLKEAKIDPSTGHTAYAPLTA